MATELKTRIILRNDTWENWNTNNPVLKQGEVAICTIPEQTGSKAEGGSVHEPAVMIKVGDGSSTFKELKFIQALAADVYDWAKAESLSIDGVTGLTEALEGKQDTIVFNTEYNGESNKAATMTDVTNAVAGIPTYEIKTDTNEEFFAVYKLVKTGTDEALGATINIPKDCVVGEGSAVVVVTPEEAGTESYPEEAGTYIKLILNNSKTSPLWINAKDLIEYDTAGTDADGIVKIEVTEDHKINVSINDGTITGAKLKNGEVSKVKLDEALTQEINDKVDKKNLAAIATTGNVDDLKQTEGTYLILNCGDSKDTDAE